LKKAKNEGGDERLVIGDRHGVAKTAEVEVNIKLGDGGCQPQQARREGKERNKDEEREGWITLDMVNDNGLFKFFINIYRQDTKEAEDRVFLTILRQAKCHPGSCHCPRRAN
jgi:hypothetical protein